MERRRKECKSQRQGFQVTVLQDLSVLGNQGNSLCANRIYSSCKVKQSKSFSWKEIGRMCDTAVDDRHQQRHSFSFKTSKSCRKEQNSRVAKGIEELVNGTTTPTVYSTSCWSLFLFWWRSSSSSSQETSQRHMRLSRDPVSSLDWVRGFNVRLSCFFGNSHDNDIVINGRVEHQRSQRWKCLCKKRIKGTRNKRKEVESRMSSSVITMVRDDDHHQSLEVSFVTSMSHKRTKS
jgi:hypothetical protein